MKRTGTGAGLVRGLALLLLAGAPSWASAQEAAGTGRVLTLRDAIESSLERNAGLAMSRAGLEQAQAQVREAWGSVLPSVNVTANYQRNLTKPQFFLPASIITGDPNAEGVVPVEVGTDNTWFAQARADQPLFNASAFLGLGAADRFETLQLEVVRGQAQQTATETRLGYYDVLLSQEQLRLSANSVRRVEQVLAETRKLHAAGLASEYDVLRLEVELANLEPTLRRAENAVDAARRGLAIAMGIESLEDVALAGSLLALELPAEPGPGVAATNGHARAEFVLERAVAPEALPIDEAVALAYGSRSDLRQLALTRELRRTERKVEMSQFLPKVSVFGQWQMNAQGDDTPRFFGPNKFSTTAIGVQVDVPLFSGFQRPARLGRLGAVVDQLDAQLEQARDFAENEVRTLSAGTREAQDRARAQSRAVEQARRGFEIARAELSAGTGSQLQVTDAELALRQSEFNYAQAMYEYLTTQARLDAAVGVVPMVDAGDVVALQR